MSSREKMKVSIFQHLLGKGDGIPVAAAGKQTGCLKANSSTSKAPAQTPVRRRSKIKPAPRSGKESNHSGDG